MSIRHTVKARGGTAVAVVAVMAVTLAGCGGSDDKPKTPEKSSLPQSQGSAPQQPTPSAGKATEPPQVIATVNGEAGMVLTINSATRDSGGFLTVSGQFKNTGDKPFANTA